MSTSSLYQKLETTARAFVLATSPKVPGTNEPDPEDFLSYTAPNFRQSWGHKHFVSTKPGLQGEVDAKGFLEHQGAMAPFFQTWEVEPTDVCVDVEKRSAVVRADFHMTVKAATVVNEIVYWITMDNEGEKVTNAVEFIDPVAAGELAEKMRAPEETNAPVMLGQQNDI